jgi:hypothetical protein
MVEPVSNCQLGRVHRVEAIPDSQILSKYNNGLSQFLASASFSAYSGMTQFPTFVVSKSKLNEKKS